MNKVLILTEAGRDIGLGHLTRCSSIKTELLQKGLEVAMLVNVEDFTLDDTKLEKTDWLSQPDMLHKFQDFDMVVVDSYLATPEYYKVLKTHFKEIVAIDDYNRINYPVDLVINPNVFFSQIDYSNQSAKCVGGRDYVILRAEFHDTETKYEVRDSIKNILITIGGSDFRQILEPISRACAKLDRIKTTILDPECKLSATIPNSDILPLQSARQMKELMIKSDIVISACGQTLHELASIGCPTIGICLDIDQVPNQKFYYEAGMLKRKINWDDKDLIQKIQQGIYELKPKEFRMKQSLLSKSIINMNGVVNITDKLIESMDA